MAFGERPCEEDERDCRKVGNFVRVAATDCRILHTYLHRNVFVTT